MSFEDEEFRREAIKHKLKNLESAFNRMVVKNKLKGRRVI